MSEPKKKLCWNCEGSVAKHLETCPYCGVYLSPSQQDPEEMPTPPYPVASDKGEAIPKPPYQSETLPNGSLELRANAPSENSIAQPLFLLLPGTTFLLFGLILWLFSEDGRFTLSWNQDWGPVFFLTSLPLLGWGSRTLRGLQEGGE